MWREMEAVLHYGPHQRPHQWNILLRSPRTPRGQSDLLTKEPVLRSKEGPASILRLRPDLQSMEGPDPGRPEDPDRQYGMFLLV